MKEKNKVIKEIAASVSKFTNPNQHLAFFGVTMFRLIDLVEKPDGDRTFLEDGIIEALLQPLISMLTDNFEGTGITVERGGHMEQLYRKMYPS